MEIYDKLSWLSNKTYSLVLYFSLRFFQAPCDTLVICYRFKSLKDFKRTCYCGENQDNLGCMTMEPSPGSKKGPTLFLLLHEFIEYKNNVKPIDESQTSGPLEQN